MFESRFFFLLGCPALRTSIALTISDRAQIIREIMELTINHKSSTPLHIQTECLLRTLVTKQEYKDGKLFPKEIYLAAKLGISRTTLRLAISKLVGEGILIRKKRYGTKVAHGPFSSKSNNWHSSSQEMAFRGITFKNFELHTTWEYPDEALANFFQINTGMQILKMESVRGIADAPDVYFASYFHPRVGLTGDEDFTRSLYELLEKDNSVIPSLSKDEITAKAADSFIAQKLEIAEGIPVLFRKRFVFDQGQRPIEYNIGYYKSDSCVYTVESSR